MSVLTLYLGHLPDYGLLLVPTMTTPSTTDPSTGDETPTEVAAPAPVDGTIVAAAVTDEDAAAEQEEPEDELLVKHIIILPPPACSTLKPIAVPPLRPDEPVASIRAALAELVGYAHMTNYQLTYNGTPLDDYGDLTILQQQQNQPNDDDANAAAGDDTNQQTATHIQMELKPYQTVREHVWRLQHLLDGNPPVVKALMETEPTHRPGTTATTATPGTTTSTTGTHAPPDPPSTPDEPAAPTAGSKKKKKEPKATADNGKTAAETGISSSPINLEHFFDAATGEKLDEALLHQLSELDHRMILSRLVTLTFLAPPSPRRKLFGDLAYIRIQIKDAPAGGAEDDEDIYVTAIASGFHRNKSTATNFDPTPVVDAPCHAHSLLDCLLQASPKFTRLWNTALETAQERLRLTATDSPLQALHRAAAAAASETTNDALNSSIRAFDSALFRPSWLVPYNTTISTTTTMRPHEPIPLDQDYPTFGLDLTTGVARDWNEELQSAREMPVATIQERLERAR